MTRIKKLGVILSMAVVGIAGTVGGASAAVAPQGQARGATTVTLDQGTIGAVVGLGLTPAAVTPGVLGMSGNDLQAAFPIVGNLKGGVIKHTGGLSLSGGGTVLELTNYFIDQGAGVLTAIATVNGSEVGRIPLFDLGEADAGFDPQKACLATASLALDEIAAGALAQIFGPLDLTGTGAAFPDLTGYDFGNACVAPR